MKSGIRYKLIILIPAVLCFSFLASCKETPEGSIGKKQNNSHFRAV